MAMTVDQLTIALGKIVSQNQKIKFRKSMRRAGKIIRDDHKKSLKAGRGPSGSPIRSIAPLPAFKKGDVIFSSRHPQSGKKVTTPIVLRNKRMANKATRNWNKRFRNNLKWKKRGGSAYKAIVRPGKPKTKTLFEMMTRKKRKGHVEIVKPDSLLIGPTGSIVSIHAFGNSKVAARDFYGLSNAATTKILAQFETQLFDDILKSLPEGVL